MKKSALHCAVDLLARREHSHRELQQKLTQREFAAKDIELAIEHLVSRHYLCDERFAHSVCRHRVKRGYGWQYIANELKHKGVSLNIIQQLHKNCEIDWYLQAELAYNKRFGIKRIEDNNDKAKRIRFLQYRGFSVEETLTALSASEKDC